jgi:uncharacterized protein GlcG (DUF336 family)
MEAERSIAQRSIAWPAAHAAVQAAALEAQRLGLNVNIAVTDRGGQLAAFLRMPGAFLHSIDIAIDKAYTAASFGFATGDWSRALERHSPAVRSGLAQRPRLVMFGGGLPLFDADELIGGVGVSGGSEDEDIRCAEAAVRALGIYAAG